MPKPKPFARIAITLPEPDLAAADRLAASQDRSRSWVIAEAIRFYAATMDAHAVEAAPVDGRLSLRVGPATPKPAPVERRIVEDATAVVTERRHEERVAARLLRLDDDLARSPEERVRAAESAECLLPKLPSLPGDRRLLAFEHVTDYLRWKSEALADRR